MLPGRGIRHRSPVSYPGRHALAAAGAGHPPDWRGRSGACPELRPQKTGRRAETVGEGLGFQFPLRVRLNAIAS